MANDLAEYVRALIAADAGASVCRFDDAVTTGFWNTTGREVPVIVRDGSLPGTVRLGDAGESWFELVSEGWSPPMPSDTDRQRIERLCELYGLRWDPKRREIYAECPVAKAPQFARKVVAATLVLDGWRVLHPADADRRRATRQELVDRVVSLASRGGLRVDESSVIVGDSGHAWAADAVLRHDRRRAGVQILEDSVPSFTERAIGWTADTHAPLVVVASPMKVERLKSAELGMKDVLAVSRDSDRAAEEVVERVAELLRAA